MHRNGGAIARAEPVVTGRASYLDPARAPDRRPIRGRRCSRAAVSARALDDFLGAAVAGAGGARDRDRTFPRAVLARPLAVAAAARARRRSDRACCGACGRRAFPFVCAAHAGRARRAAPARPRQRAAPPPGDRDCRSSSRSRRKIPIRSRCGMPMSSGRCGRRARSRSGAPSPRLAWRDPYALRALVLIACIATFFAAGGERWKRVAAAFDWQGVVLPANFRVDAWVTPPAYTGKPPIMLPGIHPGEPERRRAQAEGPVAVPVELDLDGALDRQARSRRVRHRWCRRRRKTTCRRRPAPRSIASRSPRPAPRRLRGAGEDLVWPFNAIPDKPPTIALTKDPEQQSRGSLLLSYHLEDDYGVTEARGDFRAQGRRRRLGRPGARIRSTGRRISRWCCRRPAPGTASARPSRI